MEPTKSLARLLPEELDGLAQAVADLLVARIDLEKLANIVAQKITPQQPSDNGLLLEPFFEPSDASQAIRRLLPADHQRKWSYFYSDWGCLRCQQVDRPHASNGLCDACRRHVAQQLKASLAKRTDEATSFSTSEAIARHRRRPMTAEELEQFTPETIMEPWFLSKSVETAIAQLVPVSKRRKWAYFFFDHGCLRCGRTDRRHSCLGLCKPCYQWVYFHLGASIKRHQEGRPVREDLIARLSARATTAQRILAGEEVLPLPEQIEPDNRPPFEIWKKKLGRGCARMIDALDRRGELSTQELAAATGLTERTVQDNLTVLRRNTLVESQNGKHVLRSPCEDCRQLRQTLFRPTRKRRHARTAKRQRSSSPVPETENP